jgi:hypothetical protein
MEQQIAKTLGFVQITQGPQGVFGLAEDGTVWLLVQQPVTGLDLEGYVWVWAPIPPLVGSKDAISTGD